MTSQAVMKRYLLALAKQPNQKNNLELQKIAVAIKKFKSLDVTTQEKINQVVEKVYKVAKDAGISAKKTPSKTTPTAKPKPTAVTGEIKGILAELKKKLGAERFASATKYKKRGEIVSTTIEKDIKIPALKKGKRIVRKKGYTTNGVGTFKNKVGSVYYENRANRIDENQPSQIRKYKLADGGETLTLTKAWLVDEEDGLPKIITYSSLAKAKKEQFSEWADSPRMRNLFTSIKDLDKYLIANYDEEGMAEKYKYVRDDSYRRHMDTRKRLRSDEDTYPKGTEFAKGGKTDGAKDSQLTQAEKDEVSRMIREAWEGKNIDDYVMYSDRYGKGGKLKSYPYMIHLAIQNTRTTSEMIVALFKSKGDSLLCVRALQEKAPSNFKYSMKESSKYADGGETKQLTQAEKDEVNRMIREAWEGKNIDDYVMYSDRYKRGGKMAKGGEVSKINYNDILEVLTDQINDSIDDLPKDFEYADDYKGEEVESKSRDGFIAFTDGGYEARWFEYISQFNGGGYSLPTEALQNEMERQVEYNYESAKEEIIRLYPEIAEELGEENIDYNSLSEAGYESIAEQLSDYENDSDDTIMCEIGAYYYSPENGRGIDGEHTIRLFGLVNLESPYHRSGNLEDRFDIDITFDSISELEKKVNDGLKKIINWFDGANYKDSKEKLRIVRMAKGGELKKSLLEFKSKIGAKKYRQATKGTDVKSDVGRPALKQGKRIVRKKGKTSNQWGRFKNKIGKVYNENRPNHYDVNQPSEKRKIKL